MCPEPTIIASINHGGVDTAGHLCLLVSPHVSTLHSPRSFGLKPLERRPFFAINDLPGKFKYVIGIQISIW
jgi:hypothetical protein